MVAPQVMDATAASLEREVAEARDALLDFLRGEGRDRDWRAYELKATVRNGWSDGAMNLALDDLIHEGKLVVEGDRIRLAS